MRRFVNPLRLFPGEKNAADLTGPAAPRPTKEIDPGERAITGLIAGSGSLATRLIPYITRPIINPIYEHGSTPWTLPRVRGATSFADAAEKAIASEPSRPARMMGLFDVTERPQPSFRERTHGDIKSMGDLRRLERLRNQVVEEGFLSADRIPEAIDMLEEMQPYMEAGRPIMHLDKLHNTVDSFIDKHRLAEKGVRINLQSGPLSALGGGSYNPATKEVTLPRVGKEISLHELGHAADYTTRMGRIRGAIEPGLNRGIGIALPVALAAGDRIKELFPGTVDDKAIAFMQDNAPQIMGATLAATTLYPEVKASYLAVRHLAETEGPHAARAALKKLIPFFGTYLLGAIPAVVGMSLARKYMRQARAENAEARSAGDSRLGELEKTSDIMGGLKDLAHVGKEIGRGTLNLFREPDRIKRVVQSAKEVGTSPEFVMGALGAALPATAGALYIYGTPQGKSIREPFVEGGADILLRHRTRDIGPATLPSESWREQHPLRFAGLVAMGAALSGGIMSKFLNDLGKVL